MTTQKMDDPGQKTTTIDDLLNELSKPGSQPPAQPSIPRPPSPSFQRPTPPVPPIPPKPLTSSVPPLTPLKPSPVPPPPMPLKPLNPPASSVTPTPVPPPPSFPGPSREYQSSIRTMQGDISSVKSGQKPLGVETPRKIESPVQSPVSPGLGGSVVPPPPPPPSQPKSAFKIPSAELGPTEKAKTMSPIFGAPVSRPQPIPPEKSSAPSLVIPPSSGRGIRWPLIGGIAGILIVAVFAVWFFFLRVPPEVVIETPTPTITPTETPIIKNLSFYFPSPVQNVSLIGSDNPISAVLNTASATSIAGGQFKIMSVESVTNLKEILERLLINVPVGLEDNLSLTQSAIVLYGQQETFDNLGNRTINPATSTGRRINLISEISNPTLVQSAVTAWEASLPQDLNQLFGLNWKPSTKVKFLDNTYSGIAIRYMNFSYPDRSIDYAFITASNSKTYLVISSSREAMYATIEQLKWSGAGE